MAIEYLDELADLINETGIGQLVMVETGVWEGPVDLTRIWAHDETPQFINYNDNRKRVFGESGKDCEMLTKENRENVTIQPFSNMKGDQAMCQLCATT